MVAYYHKRVYPIFRELELYLRIKPRRRMKRDKPDPLEKREKRGQREKRGR